MDDWPLEPLGELTAKIGSGATPRGGSSVYLESGVPFIRSQNVHDHRFSHEGLAFIGEAAAAALANVTVHPGDVLLNITGDSVARCCVAPSTSEPARVSQHVMIIRALSNRLEPRFLQGLLTTPATKSELFQRAGAGATRPALTKADLAGLAVPVPPLTVQRNIAKVLCALDDKVESNTRVMFLAEQLAVAHLTVVDTRSPIGMLSEMDRRSAKVSEFAGAEVEHFSLPAFDAGRVPDRCLGSSIKSSKLSISEPSVLISKLNPRISRVWHAVPSCDAVALASTEFVVLRAKSDVGSQELWAVAATEEFSNSLGERVTGTTGSRQRVRPEDVLKVTVVDPRQAPQPVRVAVRLLVDRAVAAREEVQRLARLRDALLPALMSGELRVREAQALVRERTAE